MDTESTVEYQQQCCRVMMFVLPMSFDKICPRCATSEYFVFSFASQSVAYSPGLLLSVPSYLVPPPPLTIELLSYYAACEYDDVSGDGK